MTDKLATNDFYREHRNQYGDVCGFTMTGDIPIEAIDEYINRNYLAMETIPFLIGDLLSDYAKEHGEKWIQLLPVMGSIASEKKIGTFRNWKTICGAIPKESRFPEKLGFSHHAEVSTIKDKKLQFELLVWAIETDARVKDLREEKFRRIHPDNERLQALERAIGEILELIDRSTNDSASVALIGQICKGVIK